MTLRKTLALTLAPLLIAGTAALAAGTTPGAQFFETWDYDADGQVTLAEATEHRDNMFMAFDADESGTLDAAELALLNETSAQMQGSRDHGSMQMMQGKGQGRMAQAGHGQGGHGQSAQRGHMHSAFTAPVTQEAFLAQTDAWFSMKDRNADGVIDSADLGRRF